MKTKTTWLALLAALAVIALAAVAVGCGDDDNDTKSSSSGNKTDAAFITDMTAHHQGAIDMAKVAEMRADHAEIRALADDISSAQKGEIALMNAVMDDMNAMGMHESGHMGMSEHDMGMDMDMAALENAKPFDKAFIDAMVPHHQGAITMAKAELAKGSQPALRKMANNIITAQTKEMAQMKTWRKDWYGADSGSTSSNGSGESMDMGN
jgi:uncharacterized protein (DUF305 family)